MKKSFYLILVLFLLIKNSDAQIAAITLPKHLGTMYLQWGYNRDWFSPSDIHFKRGGEYDFTLHQLKATDRPQFGEIADWDISIPQFHYRIGYFFNAINMWGIEFAFDHVKYVMDNYQTARITGSIHDEQLDKDTLVTPQFLTFEHTNGANFIMVSGIKGLTLVKGRTKKHHLIAMTKLGAGIVYPKTDVKLFNVRRDNEFHVAGFVAGAEVGLRYVLIRHIIFETSGKFSFADYTDVLVNGTAGRANHYFFCTEWLFSIGYQFAL